MYNVHPEYSLCQLNMNKIDALHANTKCTYISNRLTAYKRVHGLPQPTGQHSEAGSLPVPNLPEAPPIPAATANQATAAPASGPIGALKFEGEKEEYSNLRRRQELREGGGGNEMRARVCV